MLLRTTPAPPPRPPRPLLGPHPSRIRGQEVTYLLRAEVTAGRRDPACRLRPFNGQPTISQGSPDPSLLAILGVLRRPAAPADKLPTRVVGRNHTVIPNGSLPQAKQIYVRYIRRARWRYGAGYYIVPAGNVDPVAPVPDRCASEQQRALQQELPTPRPGCAPARSRWSRCTWPTGAMTGCHTPGCACWR